MWPVSNAEASSAGSDLVSLSSTAPRPLVLTSLRLMLCKCANSTATFPGTTGNGTQWLIIRSTMDTDCKITSEIANCVQTVAGPEANDPMTTTGEIAASDLSMSLQQVTITAGLEKILAVASATTTGSSAASGAAESTGSAASGPSETGSSSATGTSTSASSTSASSSTATNGAIAGPGQNLVLAGLSGMVGLMIAL